MPILIFGLVLFLGTHLVTTRRKLRATLIARMGEGPYKIVYALAVATGLVLIVWGFASYRQTGWVDVWYPPVWTRHLALLLVWPAFVFVAAAYLPGRIKTTLKHPMLVGVKLWAVAHLLANGDLGSILLFGSFLAWAVYDRISLKRRPDAAPSAAIAQSGWRNDVIAIAIGTLAWFVVARWLHTLLIGVQVWPGR